MNGKRICNLTIFTNNEKVMKQVLEILDKKLYTNNVLTCFCFGLSCHKLCINQHLALCFIHEFELLVKTLFKFVKNFVILAYSL